VKSTERWRPTPAHARAVLGGVALSGVALVARRPDLLVFAAPLVVVAVWGVLLRPSGAPEVRQVVDQPDLREGQVTTWRVKVVDRYGAIDDVAVAFDPPAWVDQRPMEGHFAVSLRDDGDGPLNVDIRPVRWGRHRLRPPLVVAASAWNSFRFVSQDWAMRHDVLVLPEPALFDAVAPAVHSPGLVGVNRSPRVGIGAEFAVVRPFQPGDRLRRIHWARTLRTGSLHVTSTWADHDRHVVLLVDAFEDVGESGGIDGRSSSLDIELRATAAISEHYLRAGDRVAAVTMGARRAHRLPAAVGVRHLRRLLEVLTTIEPATTLTDDGRMPRGIGHGALVLVLSPLLSPGAIQRLATVADHGLDVIAIDCLPVDIADEIRGDPYTGLAWRIELLKRERRLRHVRAAGIAVVPWRGPGSLDQVLRALHHRTNVKAGGR